MLDCDDDELTQAIMRKSNAELRTYLENPTEKIRNEDAMMALDMAASWSVGLDLLLKKDFANKALQANFLHSPLDVAIILGDFDCVKVLAGHLDFVTHITWDLAVFFQSNRIAVCIALALHKKFQLTNIDCSQYKTKQSPIAIDYDTLFHPMYMVVQTAQALFQSGFTDVDISAPGRGTPLWYHATRIRKPQDLQLISAKGPGLNLSIGSTKPCHCN
jgi:hypothetical protein